VCHFLKSINRYNVMHLIPCQCLLAAWVLFPKNDKAPVPPSGNDPQLGAHLDSCPLEDFAGPEP
jgi:hypothetical protein